MLLRSALTWGILAIIGFANGVIRDMTYGRRVSERRAHQISTATCALGMVAGSYLMLRNVVGGVRDRALLGIGAGWMIATIIFEFSFGHYVADEPWSKLARAYDLRTGQLWSAVPLTILISPLLSKRLAVRESGDDSLLQALRSSSASSERSGK